MHRALHQVLTTVAASGAHRCFGVCQDCTYLGEERNLTTANPSSRECALLGVPIQPEDAGLLCVHFSQRASTAMADIMNDLSTAICWKDN